MEALQGSAGGWPGRHHLKSIPTLAVDVLRQLEPLPLAVLHSNPGPTHTFVAPSLRTFSGLIDFGDAYLSHPAFDLVRWPAAADRKAVLEGYAGTPEIEALGSSFVTVWRIVSVLADLQSAAWDPERLEEAAAQIDAQIDQILGNSQKGPRGAYGV
jgi:hypothetical protein